MFKYFGIAVVNNIICIAILSFGCHENANESSVKANTIDSLKKSEQYLDSLKWLFYALNIENDIALCQDSTNSLQKHVNLFEIQFDISIQVDTNGPELITARPFLENDSSSCFIPGLESFDRIGIEKNKIFLINAGELVNWEHQEKITWKNQDSIPNYLISKEAKLRDRLHNYKGQINPWLKLEAIRKGVL